MRAVPDILQGRSIKKIIVIGLVLAFCVNETTIFKMEGMQAWAPAFEPEEVGVKGFSDHTQPSFDGKPVAPFTEGVCDKNDFVPNMPSFCRSDGATERLYRRFKLGFEANGIDLTRLAPIQYTFEAPEYVDFGYLAIKGSCENVAVANTAVCERNVRQLLREAPLNITGQGALDVCSRIGVVLGTPKPNFLEKYCATGTEFDRFQLSSVSAISQTDIMEEVDEHTALFVIDMQQDFTTGSFRPPC